MAEPCCGNQVGPWQAGQDEAQHDTGSSDLMDKRELKKSDKNLIFLVEPKSFQRQTLYGNLSVQVCKQCTISSDVPEQVWF